MKHADGQEELHMRQNGGVEDLDSVSVRKDFSYFQDSFVFSAT